MNSFCILMLLISVSCSQLVVNVKNNGGDVYRENIEANTTQDTITLEFRKSDGSLITQFIDGRNEVQIFRVVILPEEERGQTQIQTLCFVQRFTKNEFISSDAMSKLRQKNPSTVRHPEESRPTESFELDLLLNVTMSHVLSSHIAALCGETGTMTYTREADLQLLSQILNRDYAILHSATSSAVITNTTLCADIADEPRQPCVCRYDITVGWYPCGLKYCRGKDSSGRIVSYRCGIKTCSRTRRFVFRVPMKWNCVWDEHEFQLPTYDFKQAELLFSPVDSAPEPKPAPGENINLAAVQNLNSEALLHSADQKPEKTGENVEHAATGMVQNLKFEDKPVETKSEQLASVNLVVVNSVREHNGAVAGKASDLDDDEDGE